MKNDKDNDNKELVANCDRFNSPLTIEQTILTIRGEQVMIDRDLAMLYGLETKVLNQQVRRNIERFPNRFRFQLTEQEKSEVVTNCDHLSNMRFSHTLPYVFTEQGVAMLASVLKSDTAVRVSIQIMDAFVAMRRFISSNAGIFQRVDQLERHQIETDEKLDTILDKMEEKSPAPSREQLFQTGCIWDAWSYVSNLIRSARRNIVLIDNFVDDRVLSLLSKRADGVEATIYTRYNEQLVVDMKKHNQQYAPIELKQLPHKNHDRFLVIDDSIFLLGASVKDLGCSLCAITPMKIRPEDLLNLIK